MEVENLACENIGFSSLFAAGNVLKRSRNVPGGEERGETDVFAGYGESRSASIASCSPVLPR